MNNVRFKIKVENNNIMIYDGDEYKRTYFFPDDEQIEKALYMLSQLKDEEMQDLIENRISIEIKGIFLCLNRDGLGGYIKI